MFRSSVRHLYKTELYGRVGIVIRGINRFLHALHKAAHLFDKTIRPYIFLGLFRCALLKRWRPGCMFIAPASQLKFEQGVNISSSIIGCSTAKCFDCDSGRFRTCGLELALAITLTRGARD